MARPSASGFQSFQISGTSGSVSFTAVADRSIVVLICGTTNIFADFPYLETVTFRGVALKPIVRWAAAAGGFNNSFAFVYPRQDVTALVAGSGTLAVTMVRSGTYDVHVFNVAD